jgi:two-component system response regulator FixJ
MTPPVYVVDDDADLADSIRMVLASQAMDCRLFASADAFLAELDALPAGLILLDIFMPGTDGIDALRALKARGLDWPIVVMTSDDDPSLADLAWVAGAVEFLPKPFDGAELLRILRAQLKRLEKQD